MSVYISHGGSRYISRGGAPRVLFNLTPSQDFAHYENYFQSQFEIARRHKIMNPEKMRAEYGKLIYLMADAMKPEVKDSLGFDVKGDLMTVYKFLEEKGETELLEDKYIEVATEEVRHNVGGSRSLRSLGFVPR